MKRLLAIGAFLIPISGADAVVAMCRDKSSCLKFTTTAMPYCCKSGTAKTCPSGWTASGSTCTRASTTGSDTYGYYTQTYGTCDATEEQCYENSSSSYNSDGTACYKGANI